MSRSKILSSALAAAFVAAVCTSAPALALDAKQCLPIAEMNTVLKAEGQRTLIIGDRHALQPTDIVSYANAVTSNADGSLGYQLEGDLPRAQASTSMCVAAKLTNVRLYDARRPGVAKDAFLGGRFDDVVRENETVGTRPMVVADSLHQSSDGNERLGLPVVVFGNVAGRSGSIATRLPDGRPQMLALMGNVDYTPVALSRLGTQVAMIGPK